MSDRVAFLRRTYAHLGIALIAFALVTAGMMRYMTDFSLKFAVWGSQGWNWLVVMALFIGVNIGAQRLARSESSRGLQYVGLGLAVIVWSLLIQPMIWMVVFKFGDPAQVFASDGVHAVLSGQGMAIIAQAVVITLAIFIGLTATVFITKKDFTFMRGALSIGAFALLGTILASVMFGFSLGAVFSGLVVLLMAGYILAQTSAIMSYFPPTAHVAAALMLFATIVQLFLHVLNILASMNRRN